MAGQHLHYWAVAGPGELPTTRRRGSARTTSPVGSPCPSRDASALFRRPTCPSSSSRQWWPVRGAGYAGRGRVGEPGLSSRYPLGTLSKRPRRGFATAPQRSRGSGGWITAAWPPPSNSRRISVSMLLISSNSLCAQRSETAYAVSGGGGRSRDPDRMQPIFAEKSWGLIHVAGHAPLAVERRHTKNPAGTVETTIACEPRQNRLLIVVLALKALLTANLVSAQPLTAPTLIH